MTVDVTRQSTIKLSAIIIAAMQAIDNVSFPSID